MPAQSPADTVLIRPPIKLDIDGDAGLVSGQEHPSDGCQFLPVKRMPFRLMALVHRRLPKGRKVQSEEQQSVTWNAEESEGESCFLLRRMNAGIGTRFGLGFDGFLASD